MNGALVALITCGIVLFYVPTLAFSIASFVIAGQNENIVCDEHAVVTLSAWLQVNAGTGVGCLFFMTLFLVFGITCESVVAWVSLVVLLVLNWFFMIAWNIVGAVSLFRDSMECNQQANAIFVMVIIALSFQWFSILMHCCSSKQAKNASDN